MTYTDILSELDIDTNNKKSKQQYTKQGNIRGFEVTMQEVAKIFDIYIESE